MQSNMSAPKPDTSRNTAETITVVTDYFHEIDQLKTLLKEIQPDINRLAGKETKLLVASRKGKSIGNKSVKNRKLCELAEDNSGSQKCGGKGCKTCPLLCDAGEIFYINGKEVKVPDRFNCKTRNALYIAQCKICDQDQDNAYGGQTTQRFHKRVNGHRSCFSNSSEPEVIEKSALAEHSFLKHRDKFNLENYRMMIHNRVSARDLDRHESRLISELRTNVMGLNRMKIQK